MSVPSALFNHFFQFPIKQRSFLPQELILRFPSGLSGKAIQQDVNWTKEYATNKAIEAVCLKTAPDPLKGKSRAHGYIVKVYLTS